MEFFVEALGQPIGTLGLIAALCSLSVFAIVHTLGNPILGASLYPISIFASLCASKFFQDHHFYAQRAFDKWVLFTIMSAAIGMGLALIAYIVISRTMALMRPTRKPAELNELRVRRIQLNASRSS